MSDLPCAQCGALNSEFNPACRHCGAHLTHHSTLIGEGSRTITHAYDAVSDVDSMGPNWKIAHFQMEKILDEGGMGRVYAAWDSQLQRPVALKVLRSSRFPSTEQHDRLLKEARLASALNHRNIVTIFGVFEEGGKSIIVMEQLNGRNLDKLLPESGLPLERALDYAQGAANGLAHAHAVGVVHCDIKPGNLMVTDEGQIKILDFGIARFRDWRLDMTDPEEGERSYTLRGTLPYMSPEQAEAGMPIGSPPLGEALDARSDVFSLGVVLYESLCGQRPFQGKTKDELLEQIILAEPLPLGDIRPDLPEDVTRLVHHCLARNRDDRPCHAGEVAEAIKQIRERRSSAPARSNGEWKRRTWPAALVLLVVILVALIWRRGVQEPLQIHSLAVLPLENLSGDATLDVFSEGLAAALSNQLGALAKKYPKLWITPATELRRLGKPDVRSIHREFGVAHVITGNVRYAGSARLITLELIDAASSRLLNSKVLEVSEGQLQTAQRGILKQALSLLDFPLDTPSLDSIGALDTDLDTAYSLYLKGLAWFYRHDREGNLERALKALTRAVDQDPNYVPALAALSEVHLAQWTYRRSEGALDAGEARAREALAVNDQIAAPYMALGRISMARGQYSQASAFFEKALVLAPNHPGARYQLAKALDKMDLFEPAALAYRQAAEEAPYDWVGQTEMANFFYQRGRFDEAETVFRGLIELTPRNVLGYSNLAVILYSKGQLDEALQLVEQALTIQPSAWLYSTLGYFLFAKRQFQESAEAFEQAVALNPNGYLFHGNLADAYRQIPDRARAERAYLRAVELLRESLAINPSDHQTRSDLALYLAKLERAPEALAELARIGEPDDLELIYKSALIHELTGHRVDALQFLQRALALNYPLDDILAEPEFESLRRDPGFSAISQPNRDPAVEKP